MSTHSCKVGLIRLAGSGVTLVEAPSSKGEGDTEGLIGFKFLCPS